MVKEKSDYFILSRNISSSQKLTLHRNLYQLISVAEVWFFFFFFEEVIIIILLILYRTVFEKNSIYKKLLIYWIFNADHGTILIIYYLFHRRILNIVGIHWSEAYEGKKYIMKIGLHLPLIQWAIFAIFVKPPHF